jgi:DNA (cytosine-5)-methyltransferase 1
MNQRRSDMKHVDLFSGLGGFALAAHANKIKTVCFCEKDEKCRAFLSKAWPGVAIHDDIKTFDGRQYAGAYLLTAGVPCQPASRAGKQRGAADDRWLWPAAIRALEEVRPAWAIFENPPGIGDVGLAGILSDVENKGYAVRVFSIPACAVGSPQRRERFWIVCRNLADTGLPSGRTPKRPEQHEAARPGADTQGDLDDAAQAEGARLGEQRQHVSCKTGQGNLADTESGRGRPGLGEGGKMPESGLEFADRGIWQNNVWMPCADGKVRRAPDDSFRMADGLPVELLEELGAEGRQTPKDCETHRSLIGALGNAIVWPLAAMVIKAIVDADNGGIMDTYPDKSELERYDDAERAAIKKADRMLDDEKNRIQESQTTGDRE